MIDVVDLVYYVGCSDSGVELELVILDLFDQVSFVNKVSVSFVSFDCFLVLGEYEDVDIFVGVVR